MEITAIAQKDLQNAFDRLAKSAERTANTAAGEKADYAREVVEQIGAEHQARANAHIAEVGNRINRRLLDIFA